MNGEGFGKLETDAGKAVQGRLTLDPLVAGGSYLLPITGFVSYDTDATAEVATLTWVGAAGFKAPWLVVWAEATGVATEGTRGMGGSATLLPKLPDVVGLVLRYDQYDPDTSAEQDAETFVIAGLSRDWARLVSTALTYERGWTEATAETPTQGVYARLQARW